MQSAIFKLHYFWSSLMPSLNASGKDAWQWLHEGIDFGKGSLNILKYVNNKSLVTNPSHPVCLFMWLGHIASKLGPNKFHIGNSCHSTCLALVSKWVSTDNISFPQSSFI